MCTDSSCQGDSNEQCTEGVLAGCDCFNAPSSIVDSYPWSWIAERQLILAMLSGQAPGWEYTTITGYGTGNPTAGSQSTTTSNATISSTTAPTSAVSTTTSWYVHRGMILSHVKLVLSLRTHSKSQKPLNSAEVS